MRPAIEWRRERVRVGIDLLAWPRLVEIEIEWTIPTKLALNPHTVRKPFHHGHANQSECRCGAAPMCEDGRLNWCRFLNFEGIIESKQRPFNFRDTWFLARLGKCRCEQCVFLRAAPVASAATDRGQLLSIRPLTTYHL
jgi:hypothetical protein